MNKFLKFAFLPLVVLISFAALAQSPAPAPAPSGSIWDMIAAFLASLKSGGPYAIVAAAVQVVMQFLNSTLANVGGKWKVIVVALLTLVGSVVSGLAQGETIMQILTDASVLSALQVFIHQLITQPLSPSSST